ncbi:NAD(P)H-dependent oxidoreductase [Phenylobacterium sp.]|uniref:FMN-dependent NADH-azoreductase n=1 Tax=Phenylobacterium sp. TaxID=1871053 RepID=UPI0028128C1F|nr:NAD(P)H-dependent oxidoreductase [Phenylobacterium sp.]
MKLLHIDAGITGSASVSRQITASVVDALMQADPTLRVTRRDLAATPIPHLDGSRLEGLADNEILREFLDTDVVVIGAPMYNFGLPSQLKAWFDHILVAGRTFRYGAAGPEGLVKGKTVIVASSRGGEYAAGGPRAAFDFQERHLQAMLQFTGIDDVVIIRAEGVALSPESREAALANALEAAKRLPQALAAKLAA